MISMQHLHYVNMLIWVKGLGGSFLKDLIFF